jgi:hypothetical protein
MILVDSIGSCQLCFAGEKIKIARLVRGFGLIGFFPMFFT